jgi:hypothetical protein
MHPERLTHKMLMNPAVPIVKRKRGAQPGNKNRLRHGLHSKEWLALRAKLRAEIRTTRALLRTAGKEFPLPRKDTATEEGRFTT